MKARAIRKEQLGAWMLLSIALAFAAGRARAEDAAMTPAAPPAVVVMKERVVVLQAISRGGMRPGEVMLFTESGVMERMKETQLAPLQLPAVKLNPLENCVKP